MQPSTPEMEHIRTLRYSELKEFCKIVDIEVRDLAKLTHLTKEKLYNTRYLKKDSDDRL
jgi:hypothetical protein